MRALLLSSICLFFLLKPAVFIIALTFFPNMAGKALSTIEFCCGVPGAVYSSKSIPISSSRHCLSRMLFSPVLSHQMCFIFFLYVSHNSFKSRINFSFVSDFFHEEAEFHVRGFICYEQPYFEPPALNVFAFFESGSFMYFAIDFTTSSDGCPNVSC